MSISNDESGLAHAELEHQIKQVMNESDSPPHLIGGEPQVQPKILKNYDAKMRSHAARCEAGR